MTEDYAITKARLEADELRTVARIVEDEDGGPVHDLITGREPHTVGMTVCIKAGMRAVPWESIKAERPMIELCEVASPVKALMAQPHEIFMKVVGEDREWMYRPDIRLSVDSAFADTVLAGTPFSQAVAEWRPGKKAGHHTTLIVEVKDDRDPRIDDPIYLLKLSMARKAYQMKNWKFFMVVRSRDLDNTEIARSVRQIMLDHDVSLSPRDIDLARKPLGSGSATLGDVVQSLGGGQTGLAKSCALHVRRIISIDLRNDLRPDTPVLRMPDQLAIFEMEGKVQW